MANAAMRTATAKSGHAVPVPNTPSAATRTPTLRIASLREQIPVSRLSKMPQEAPAAWHCGRSVFAVARRILLEPQ